MTDQASKVSGNVSVHDLVAKVVDTAYAVVYSVDSQSREKPELIALEAALENWSLAPATSVEQPREIPAAGVDLEIYGYQCRQSATEKFFLHDYPHYWQHLPLVRQADAMAEITRLQAEVAGLQSERSFFVKRNDKLHTQIDALQSDLTKAREVIGALAKGFNTLEQESGKYRINMSFSGRGDAWSAYTALSQFNASAHQSAPVAKCEKCNGSEKVLISTVCGHVHKTCECAPVAKPDYEKLKAHVAELNEWSPAAKGESDA